MDRSSVPAATANQHCSVYVISSPEFASNLPKRPVIVHYKIRHQSTMNIDFFIINKR